MIFFIDNCFIAVIGAIISDIVIGNIIILVLIICDVIIVGKIFCIVIMIKHISQVIACIIIGSHRWNGIRPNFIIILVNNIILKPGGASFIELTSMDNSIRDDDRL